MSQPKVGPAGFNVDLARLAVPGKGQAFNPHRDVGNLFVSNFT
jgi:hypothetical protein